MFLTRRFRCQPAAGYIDSYSHRDQIIFRVSLLLMRQAADQRKKAQPRIVHVLKLRASPPVAEPTSSSPEPAPEAFSGLNPFSDAAPGDAVDIIQLQTALLAQGQEIDNIGSTGIQVASQIEKSLRDVQSEVRETQSSIDDLREEGTRVRSDVSSLREDLRNALDKYPHHEWVSTLKGLIKDRDDMITGMGKREKSTRRKVDDLGVRLDAHGQELEQATARDEELQEDIMHIKRHAEQSASVAKANAKRNEELEKEILEAKHVAEVSLSTARQYSLEVSSMRKELKQLRADLTVERSERQNFEKSRQRMEEEQHRPAQSAVGGFSAHELDILTSRISDIGDRASQVDSLKMEVELIKSRVRRLENNGSSAAELVATPPGLLDASSARLESESDGLLDGNTSSPCYRIFPGAQKRKRPPVAEHEDELYELDLPSAELDLTSDYYSATITGSSSTRGGQDSSPWQSASGHDRGVRYTKRGTVDRRYGRYANQNKRASKAATAKG